MAGPRRSTQDRRQQRARNAAFSLFITSGLLGRLLEEELDSSGLTPNDLGMLSAIGMPGGITPSALAEQLGVRQSTLTTRIQALVDRRLVRRVSHPVDGRSYQLELTAAGTRAWEDAAAALRASLSRIERALAVPIDDLEEALVELERALRATLEDGTTS